MSQPQAPGRLKALIDLGAGVAVIVLCATMTWTTLAARRPAARTSKGTIQSGRPAPTDPSLPTRSPVSFEGAPTAGESTARLAILEYSDFQCPYCGRFANETLPELKRRYLATGQVLFAFRHFPLESIHPFAMRAALSAACAQRQGRFWDLHDRYFAASRQWNDTLMSSLLGSLPLDNRALDECVARSANGAVRADLESGRTLGVSGTPTFFIGSLDADRRLQIAKRITGAQPISAFSEIIESLLHGTTPMKNSPH